MGHKKDTVIRDVGRKVIKLFHVCLERPSCSYGDSDSGLEGIFEPIWSPFRGVPFTTMQGGPTSAHPRDGQLIPQVCWAHLLTGQPFALDTCLPYFLAIGSNLARAYLNKVPREEAKESGSQNHPEAKAKPALPEAAYFCTHRDEASLLS